jgi:predicted amidohydrolase
MREIRVGAAQFESRDADREHNLERIRRLTAQAANQGAEVICFHECCLTGFTFLENLSGAHLAKLAEPVPDGYSTKALIKIARKFRVAIGAGLIEVADKRDLYNTYVVVSPDGFIARHRKLHPFINDNLRAGNEYTVFDLLGCRFGVLTCYDNNVIENVRTTTLLGADIILMPHVTGGLPSPMPGRGRILHSVWEHRERDPMRCRMEFTGPKGRGWLMHWLPARAYDNGIYAVFSNAVGVDANTIKPGNAMIVDPYGDVLVESHALGDDVVVGLLTPDKIELSGGRRYIRARRPELYAKLVEPTPAEEKEKSSSRFADVYWKKHPDEGEPAE